MGAEVQVVGTSAGVGGRRAGKLKGGHVGGASVSV